MIDIKRFEENIKIEQEIDNMKLEIKITKSKIRKSKIDILKNGSKKDKINLLIKERLQQLEEEENRSNVKQIKN